MKFYKYKQLARINCVGFDDELLDDPQAYYYTPIKKLDRIDNNTKLMRFRLKGLNNIQIGKHAKLVLESIYVPIPLDDEFDSKVRGAFTVRLKKFSSLNTFDSSNTNSSAILFSSTVPENIQIFFAQDATGKLRQDASGNLTHLDSYRVPTSFGVPFFNHSPKVLYNFDIPNKNFLNQNMLEFELIYYTSVGFELSVDDFLDFQGFQCSLVIYDLDEEDLLLKDTDEVNFKLMRPQNPIFKI